MMLRITLLIMGTFLLTYTTSPIRLTERGRGVSHAVGEKIARIVNAASEGLSEAERQTMYRALTLISENLETIYAHKKTGGGATAAQS